MALLWAVRGPADLIALRRLGAIWMDEVGFFMGSGVAPGDVSVVVGSRRACRDETLVDFLRHPVKRVGAARAECNVEPTGLGVVCYGADGG